MSVHMGSFHSDRRGLVLEQSYPHVLEVFPLNCPMGTPVAFSKAQALELAEALKAIAEQMKDDD